VSHQIRTFNLFHRPHIVSNFITIHINKLCFIPFQEKLFLIWCSFGTLQAEMQRFVEKIVSMMKSERLFEWQGGPIIMSQVGKTTLDQWHCRVQCR
jgi:hypothetical protein